MNSKQNKHEWFVDLAPVSRTKDNCIYKSALDFCVQDKDIHNIALTGPYGSGKSSVIKGYKEKLPENVKLLEISLASFENKKTPSDAEIELSILQQMIYSAASSALPYSRFKRIKTPIKPDLNALIITLWMIGAFILFQYSKEIFTVPMWTSAFYSLIFFIGTFLFGSWWVIKYLYTVAFSASFRKISLKNFEIEKDVDNASILNKHVDEVLYFFEQTDYNLVVFEDLDRFDSPDIFIKLRELNSLVNKSHSVGVERHIQFIYALKDSTFTEKERTKFFDFIIPVVPVVGTYNSLDIINKRIQMLPKMKHKLDRNFLRDVSDFLNDARLIHNTFNEFVVYQNEINDNEISPTYLLALMLYKNIFGEDFEALHNSKGVFYEVLRQKQTLLNKRKEHLYAEIANVKENIKMVDAERASTEYELISAYIGELLRHVTNPSSGVRISNQFFAFSSMKSLESIRELLTEKNITFAQHGDDRGWKSNISFLEIEKAINPDISLLKRVSLVQQKPDKIKVAYRKKIHDLEQKISELDQFRLAELFQEYPESFEWIIANIDDLNTNGNRRSLEDESFDEIVGIRLFRFLILSGYLNEDYHLYTAIFRERDDWSSNDRLFTTIMKSRDIPRHDLKIDHPVEVCARLSQSDFSSNYVFNISLFDYLLDESTNEQNNKELALKYLAKSFDSDICQDFLSMYLDKGNKLNELFKSLLREWPSYISALLRQNYVDLHLAKLLTFADQNTLSSHEEVAELIQYLETNISSVYANENIQAPSPQSYDLLKALNIQVTDLRSIESNSTLLSFLHKECLFNINSSNIHYLLGLYIAESEEVLTKTYKILSENDEIVTSYVNNHLSRYIESVMLNNEFNTEEPEDIIITIVNNNSLSPELIKRVITHQNYVFPNLESIEEVFWEHILEEEKVIPDWNTLFQCYMSKLVDNSLIVEYLAVEEFSRKLEKEAFLPKGTKDEILSFKRFIFNLDDLADEIYIRLNRALGTKWAGFPKVSSSKQVLLASNGFVMFSNNSYLETEGNSSIRVALIKRSYQHFQKNIESFVGTINQDVALGLYDSEELPSGFKLALTRILDVSILSLSSDLSNLAAPFHLKLDESELNLESVHYLIKIVHDEEIGLALFERMIKKWGEDEALSALVKIVDQWSENTVMAALNLCSPPISTITRYGKKPLLPKSELNIKLTNALSAADYIGKVSDAGASIRVNTKRKSFDKGSK